MNLRGTRSAAFGLLVLVSVLLQSAQPAVAADTGVFGYWKRIDDETGKAQSFFRLWEDKGKLVGKIIKVLPTKDKKAQEVCTECTGAQANKPVNGLLFLWGFSRDQSNASKWIDGTVLNPENGKTYHCEVELSEDGNTLNVYGYLKLLVKLGGTSKWQRATPEEVKGL
jgi:uncharacterized protein (DUF2147 family)